MAQRSRASLKKRQRELQRQEKQRDKVARREQRKMEKALHPGGLIEGLDAEGTETADAAVPEDEGETAHSARPLES